MAETFFEFIAFLIGQGYVGEKKCWFFVFQLYLLLCWVYSPAGCVLVTEKWHQEFQACLLQVLLTWGNKYFFHLFQQQSQTDLNS